MNKTLMEIENEIKELEKERNAEAMNRINALGALWNIQNEIGSVFGIVIPKEVQNFDNEKFDAIVSMLLNKLNYLEGVYAKADSYDKENFERETYGVSEEKFNEYALAIKKSLKSLKISNSKLDGIWQKEMNLGKEKSAKEAAFDDAYEKIEELKNQIAKEKEEISSLEQYINDKKARGTYDTADEKYYNNKLKIHNKNISDCEAKIQQIYISVNKDEFTAYMDKKHEEEQKRIDEEQKRLEEEAKQDRIKQFHEKVAQQKVSQELDEAEAVYTGANNPAPLPTPQQVAAQAQNLTQPEPQTKPKAIAQIGDLLKKVIDSKATKTVAILGTVAAAIATGMTMIPGIMLGAAGLAGYNEIKKGMGK